MAFLRVDYRCRIKKARADHICYECGDEIVPGENYYYHESVWYSSNQPYKTCTACEGLRREIERALGEETCFGGLQKAFFNYSGLQLEHFRAEIASRKDQNAKQE